MCLHLWIQNCISICCSRLSLIEFSLTFKHSDLSLDIPTQYWGTDFTIKSVEISSSPYKGPRSLQVWFEPTWKCVSGPWPPPGVCGSLLWREIYKVLFFQDMHLSHKWCDRRFHFCSIHFIAMKYMHCDIAVLNDLGIIIHLSQLRIILCLFWALVSSFKSSLRLPSTIPGEATFWVSAQRHKSHS